MEDHILGINAGRQFSVDVDPADLRLADCHGLGREHVPDLAGADAEGDGPKSAMGRSVRVAARDRRAGLRDPLFGADDVDNALLAARKIEKFDSGVRAVFPQRLDHGIGKVVAEWLFAFIRGDNVIHGREGARGVEDFESEVAQHSECLWAGHLVDEVGADEKLGGSVRECPHGVRIPDFVE